MDDGRIVNLEENRKNGVPTNHFIPGPATLPAAEPSASSFGMIGD
jgi:hypothetical protein